MTQAKVKLIGLRGLRDGCGGKEKHKIQQRR